MEKIDRLPDGLRVLDNGTDDGKPWARYTDDYEYDYLVDYDPQTGVETYYRYRRLEEACSICHQAVAGMHCRYVYLAERTCTIVVCCWCAQLIRETFED